jgi:hypothetical protein
MAIYACTAGVDMTQDEIDTMWQQAMRQSIEEGEMFTRYHFAKLVAAKTFKDGYEKGVAGFNEAVLIEREACHPPQRTWVGLTKEDMPSGENPMFDHKYFIAGMVFAAKILEEKNT